VNRWRRRRGTLLVGLAVLVLASCAGDRGSAGPTSTGPPTTAAGSGTSAGRRGPAGQGPQRIVVVVEENHSFDQIIGDGRAPFSN
jgi:phosphatidylinositol-3-phosphatase